MCVWGTRDRLGCVSGGLVIGLAVCLGDRDRLGRVSGGCVSGGAEWKPHACAVATGADGAQPRHLSDPLDALPSRCSAGRQSLCVYFVG